MTLADEGFKSAFDILEEMGKAGIQRKRKRHISFQSESTLSDEVKPSTLKKVLGPSPPSKNLSLNSNDEGDHNKGKNFDTELEIQILENLSLVSLKSKMQNKGKILVRLGSEEFELEKTHRKKKLEFIVELENFKIKEWGSGSYRIKAVNDTPKKCRGCPHLYLTFRWYEGSKQKERVIGKVNRRYAIG